MSLSSSGRQAILEAYVNLFHIAASLSQRQNMTPGAMDKIRRQVEHALQEERRRLISATVPDALVEELQLAVVALVDEAVARQPSFREVWKPLSLQLYGHYRIGHQVFEHLNVLRRNPATPVEVLEVYARCLTWGLQGEYYPDRLEELSQLQLALQNELRMKQGALPSVIPPMGGERAAAGRWVLRHTWAAAGLVVILLLCWTAFQLGFYLLAKDASVHLARIADNLSGAADQRAR